MTSKKFNCWKLILDVCEYCPKNLSLRPLARAIKFPHTEVLRSIQRPKPGPRQILWGMSGASTKHPAVRLSAEWSGRSTNTSQLPEHPLCYSPLSFLCMDTVVSPDEAATRAPLNQTSWYL